MISTEKYTQEMPGSPQRIGIAVILKVQTCVSHYDIKNAFLQQFMPLSDNVHGPFRMMPPELLQTSGSELIMYMFESLGLHLGGSIDQDYIDQEHIVVSNIIKKQSERDFPRGLMCNGNMDGTKIQSSKRKGNLF
jgi:hypothetical protein